VIFDCPAAGVAMRASQIAEWLSGRYPVTVNGREWKPEVEADVAVVEYMAGEAPGDFVLRASAQVPTRVAELTAREA
jgi:hypothetical protein